MHRGSKDEKTRSCPISCYSRPACPGLGTGHHSRRSLLRLGHPRHRRVLGSIPGLTPAVVLYARQKSPWTAAQPRTEVWTARSTEKKRDSSLCPLIHIFVVGRVLCSLQPPPPGEGRGCSLVPCRGQGAVLLCHLGLDWSQMCTLPHALLGGWHFRDSPRGGRTEKVLWDNTGRRSCQVPTCPLFVPEGPRLPEAERGPGLQVVTSGACLWEQLTEALEPRGPHGGLRF